MWTGPHAAHPVSADKHRMSNLTASIHPAICHMSPSLASQLLLILLVSGYAGYGNSAIFACQSGNSTVYQDAPCQIRQAADATVKNAPEYPLGMHASWFELPEQANERAFCDSRGCECGLIERRHQSTIALTVADALYIDGSWHRYQSSYDKWLAAPASSAESYVHREEMLDASCHIMMSQLILKKYADDVMDRLEERVKTAEEHGFDSELPCEQDIAEACDYFKSTQLYARLQKDAAALRVPRDASIYQ